MTFWLSGLKLRMPFMSICNRAHNRDQLAGLHMRVAGPALCTPPHLIYVAAHLGTVPGAVSGKEGLCAGLITA